MKFLVTISCLIFFWGQITFCQSNGESNDKPASAATYQFGANVGRLVSSLRGRKLPNILLFDSPSDAIIFKYQKNGKAFRAGLGFEYFNQEKRVSSRWSIRTGFERQKVISKKWQMNIGFEVRFSSSKFNFSSNQDPITSRVFTLSPVLLGIQYKLFPHIYLQTESALNIFYGVSKNNIFITNPVIEPIFPAVETNSLGTNFTIPTTLLLVLEF